jgi:hypothetical protein
MTRKSTGNLPAAFEGLGTINAVSRRAGAAITSASDLASMIHLERSLVRWPILSPGPLTRCL